MPWHCPSNHLLTQYSVPLIKFKLMTQDKDEEKTSITQLCAGVSIISSYEASVHSHYQDVELPLFWAISPALQTVRNKLCWELGPGPPCFGSGAAPELRHGLGCAIGMPGLASPDLTWLGGLLSWTSHFLMFTGVLLAGSGHCKGPCLLGASGALPAMPCTTLGSPSAPPPPWSSPACCFLTYSC